jgi:hypothetical protein
MRYTLFDKTKSGARIVSPSRIVSAIDEAGSDGSRCKSEGRPASAGRPAAPAAASEPVGRLEIVLIGGQRIVVGAEVDGSSLARAVAARSQSRRSVGCGWRRAIPICGKGSTNFR